VFPVRQELGFYTPEYGILHSHRRENLKSYIQSFLVIRLQLCTSNVVVFVVVVVVVV
jgi:hypothetical protein